MPIKSKPTSVIFPSRPGTSNWWISSEKAKTREQIIEFNKKVDTLNKRVAAYEKKGQDYKALVDAYNKRIMKQHSEDQTQ